MGEDRRGPLTRGKSTCLGMLTAGLMTLGGGVEAPTTGAVEAATPAAECRPADNIAAIIDDSGSMKTRDPERLRRSALEMLITKPSNQTRTLGATEFGAKASTLFDPALIEPNRRAMIQALARIRDDGSGLSGDNGRTNYNTAFQVSSETQSDAEARLFLTDGEHNEGEYQYLHRGGPPTYVVGLGIGPAGQGNRHADLLQQIATETNGRYFSILRKYGSTLARIQPVFNVIDSLMQCRAEPKQAYRNLKPEKRVSKTVGSRFSGTDSLEVVVAWSNPTQKIKLQQAVSRGPKGGIAASLSGRARSKNGKRRKVKKMRPKAARGPGYVTFTFAKPKRGKNLRLKLKAPKLRQSMTLSVQIGSVPRNP